MATEAAIAAKNELSQKRMTSAVRALVEDEALLERLEATQLAHRDPQWQDSEHKAVLADVMEYLLARYAAVPAGGVDKDVSELLKEADYDDPEEVRKATDEELLAIDGIGPKKLQEIRDATGPHEPPPSEEEEAPASPEQGDDQPPTVSAAARWLDTSGLADALQAAGYRDVESVRAASDDDLLAIKGIGPKKLKELREVVG